MSLLGRILLTIMAAMGWCYRAQSATNAEGAPKHVRNGVMEADFFLLLKPFTLKSSLGNWRASHVLGTNAFFVDLR